jgi:hypothetical protein
VGGLSRRNEVWGQPQAKTQDLIQKTVKAKKAECVTEVAEHLPRKGKAPSSKPSTTNISTHTHTQQRFKYWISDLSFFGLYFFIVVLGGGTLWHLQKFSQYIKYILLKCTLPLFSFIPPPLLE